MAIELLRILQSTALARVAVAAIAPPSGYNSALTCTVAACDGNPRPRSLAPAPSPSFALQRRTVLTFDDNSNFLPPVSGPNDDHAAPGAGALKAE